MIDLPSDEIHLWLVNYAEIRDNRLNDAYRALLNDQEKAQEARFYFLDDRCRYLTTRALVRAVLSRYVGVPPSEWIFAANAYGRPEVQNVEARGVSFNIAHTHSLIVLGVAKGRALGVDVENILVNSAPIDIANRYFAPTEVSALNGMPRDQQQYRFFEYWTFKESYIKARGMGLSIPLDKFHFQYPNDRGVELTIDPELKDDSARWQFWQFRPALEYLTAVCAERIDGRSPRFVVRSVVPLETEKILAPIMLRVSD